MRDRTLCPSPTRRSSVNAATTTTPRVAAPASRIMLGRGGDWSQECSNPACYGVPLYRQFLTGTSTSRELQTWNTNCSTDAQKATDACRWPFVRMGGQSTYQRSTLTANHGTYFLDTSVSYDTQCETGRRSIHDDHALRQPQRQTVGRLLPAQRECVQERPDLLHVLPLCETRDQADLPDLRRARLHPQGQPRRRRQRSPCHKPGARQHADAEHRLRQTGPAKWTKNYNDDAACGIRARPAAACSRSRSTSAARPISIRRASASPPPSAR